MPYALFVYWCFEFADQLLEVTKVAIEDRFKDRAVEFLIGVNGDVAEAHHVAHDGGSFGPETVGLLKQAEGIAAGLRDADPSLGDMVHGKINGGFAGPEEVQDDGILNGGVVKTPGIATVLLGEPLLSLRVPAYQGFDFRGKNRKFPDDDIPYDCVIDIVIAVNQGFRLHKVPRWFPQRSGGRPGFSPPAW